MKGLTYAFGWQVYELDSFRVTHVSKYPAPVLSVGISPNSALFAVGLADGQLVMRKHSHNKGPAGETHIYMLPSCLTAFSLPHIAVQHEPCKSSQFSNYSRLFFSMHHRLCDGVKCA